MEMRPASNQPQKTLRGHLERWTHDGLVLNLRNGQSMEIGKSKVRRVVLREKGRPGRGAAIGAAIGFGIGFPIGAAAATINPGGGHSSGGEIAGGGVLAGAIFGAIGALIGKAASGTRRTTLYQAR